MELIRKIERNILRKATGIYKNRITKKYKNSKILYEKAKTNQIDRKLIENNLKTIEKIDAHENNNTSEMVAFSDEYHETKKYKPMCHFSYLNKKNRLFKNKKTAVLQ